MAILDENGRLFGRVHLIDFAALIGIAMLAALFVFGYRLYASNYRELVRQEREDEIRFQRGQEFSTTKPATVALIVYSKIPGYLRDAVSVGDAEVRSEEAELPLRLLALQPAEGKPGMYFLLLGGEVRMAASGALLAGVSRPLRLGGTFSFLAKRYRLSGEIVRLLPGGAEPKELPRLVRQLRMDE